MSFIGTSINIEKKRLSRFQKAAETMNISETDLLSMLLGKSRSLFGDTAVTKQAVRYQRDYDKADFAIHHVVFADVDYEFATGRRYVFKISVSFLIRLAIDLFLTEILQEWLLNTADSAGKREEYKTNFHYRHFDIHHVDAGLTEFWIIPWPKSR